MSTSEPLDLDWVQALLDGIGDLDWGGYIVDNVGELVCGPVDEHGWKTGLVASWCEEDEGRRPTPVQMAFISNTPYIVGHLLAEVRKLRAVLGQVSASVAAAVSAAEDGEQTSVVLPALYAARNIADVAAARTAVTR